MLNNAVVLIAALIVGGTAAGTPPAKKPGEVQYGFASYYGKGLQGKKTADGEAFDKNDITAAHPAYPAGTRLAVTNLRNGRTVDVRVNDRGPAKRQRRRGVIIDLSERAAHELGFKHDGYARVKTRVIEWGPVEGAARAAAAN